MIFIFKSNEKTSEKRYLTITKIKKNEILFGKKLITFLNGASFLFLFLFNYLLSINSISFFLFFNLKFI